tara:strand:+ start:263 stop:673 length:411 start_codon:yes stop_codon:yes gene_type:complete
MQLKKNIQLGKIKLFLLVQLLTLTLMNDYSSSDDSLKGNFVELQILDKINSKNSTINLKIGEEKKFKNLIIKALKCQNSKFDDNPEITAYLQVKDITNKNKNKVFVFNGWTFASSPSLEPFDHPVYDIWLKKCKFK